jgi:hypothetical protein
MMKKLEKNQHICDQLQPLNAILTQWQCPVASTKALDFLNWAMHAVLYRPTAVAIKMASKVGPFFCRFVCCCPGGCLGNTERVVTRWRHPVAFGVALEMLNWAMPSVLLRSIPVAIEMANDGGAFVHHCCLFCMIIRSYKTMFCSI